MIPTFIEIPEKKMIGKTLSMSMRENRIFELWSGFMPDLRLIKSRKGNTLFSIEKYPMNYFDALDPEVSFEKWACVEVNEFIDVPQTLERLTIPGGLYAIFQYKGHPQKAASTFEFIFSEWLPNSEYLLDERPHMEVMGDNYKNNSDDSEEEFWIPVILK